MKDSFCIVSFVSNHLRILYNEQKKATFLISKHHNFNSIVENVD